MLQRRVLGLIGSGEVGRIFANSLAMHRFPILNGEGALVCA